MLSELISLCRQVVTIEPFVSFDVYGEQTFGTAASHRARVVGKRRLVRNFQGEEVVSSHTVYLASSPAVGPHDRITLSTGDVHSTELGALQPTILAAGRYPDDAGRVHVTVFL